jgi:hypothetical protein
MPFIPYPLTFVSKRAAVVCVVLHSGWKNSYKLTFAVLYREGTRIIARTRHRLGIERMIELLAISVGNSHSSTPLMAKFSIARRV